MSVPGRRRGTKIATAEAAKADELAEAGHTKGKLVLVLPD